VTTNLGNTKLQKHSLQIVKLCAKTIFGDQNNFIFLGKMRNSRYYIIVNVPSSILFYPIYVANFEVKVKLIILYLRNNRIQGQVNETYGRYTRVRMWV
jgi:hypothetical protein